MNYKIFEWCEWSISRRCKYLNFRSNAMLRDADITLDTISDYREIKDNVASFLSDRFKNEWLDNVNKLWKLKNKLRTYSQHKQDYKSETYLKCPMPRAPRSAYTKFRCRVALIRIETRCCERLDYNLR